MEPKASLVSLTLRYGQYREQEKTVAVTISASLADELLGPVEMSDAPISLVLASPGVFGGKGSALTFRRRTFEMRRKIAQEIADAMVPALLKAFGVNDVLDGYRIEDMSDDEREWHEMKGRLDATRRR